MPAAKALVLREPVAVPCAYPHPKRPHRPGCPGEAAGLEFRREQRSPPPRRGDDAAGCAEPSPNFKDAIRGRLEEGTVPGSVRRLALVPTVGALHDGHARLVRTAVAENDVVVVTVFVNELQFNDREDFLRYPRTLEADVELLAGAGAGRNWCSPPRRGRCTRTGRPW